MDKLKEPTLLIDGDILAYRASAATDGRQYVITYEKEGQTVTMYEEYKKEADRIKKNLEAQGLTVNVEKVYEPEPFANAVQIMKKTIESLETQLGYHVDGIGSLRFFLTRNGSFREALFPAYKSNRDDMHRPYHLEACKDYLIKHYGAECRQGEYEADDLLAINQGPNTIVCSIDKDLLQVPGHHFNWVRNEYKVVTEEEGRRSLYAQMLTGDTSDGIPGLYGIGPKKAEKLLKDISSEWMMYCVVLKMYLEHLGRLEDESKEDYEERVIKTVRLHAQMLYLLRSEDDEWAAPENN